MGYPLRPPEKGNTMTKYRNEARDAQLEAELATEEAEYRKRFGDQPIGEEENAEIDPPATTKDEEIWKKRHADLRSYSQKQVNERDFKIAELEKALADKEKQHLLPQNKTEAEEWVKEYPDLARVISTLIDERAEKQVSSVSDEVRSVKMQLEAERESIQRDRAMNEVLKAHPDFLDLINKKEFKEWVESQPLKRGRIGQALYDALYDNNTDADAAIQAVNIYKQDTAAPKKERNEAALSVRRPSSPIPESSNGKPTFTESDIDKMDRWTYDKYEKEIEEARREGRIIYDQSGAAR